MAMTPKTSPEIGGMGHSIKRKEDPRFLRGQGKYVDDVVLPGMLYLDIVRSPYAHAKIVKIDASKAMAIPGVLAVITGEMLKQYNLHWMPTLMSDTQMVLPVEKVMHQGQEVAAVLATTRYIGERCEICRSQISAGIVQPGTNSTEGAGPRPASRQWIFVPSGVVTNTSRADCAVALVEHKAMPRIAAAVFIDCPSRTAS